MLKRLVRRLNRFFEEDEFTSSRLRQEFAEKHDIHVGLFSYGCFDKSRIGRGTVIGRYCSFAPTACVFRRNHGIDFLGLTPYLYNAALGVVEADKIASRPLKIEDDVWLGHNSIILPSVARIGRGAIVAAGAVVTTDVEPYAIVAGNPAKELRKRFDASTITHIEESCWWEKDPAEIKLDLKSCPDKYFDPEGFFPR